MLLAGEKKTPCIFSSQFPDEERELKCFASNLSVPGSFDIPVENCWRFLVFSPSSPTALSIMYAFLVHVGKKWKLPFHCFVPASSSSLHFALESYQPTSLEDDDQATVQRWRIRLFSIRKLFPKCWNVEKLLMTSVLFCVCGWKICMLEGELIECGKE